MSRSFPVLASLAALAVAGAVAISAPAAAVGPTTLYANPDGAGEVCSPVDPCSLDSAMTDAGSGDTIMIEAGNYGTKGTPLIGELSLTSDNVTLRAATGATPVINSQATVALVMTTGSTLAGVVLNFTGTKAALDVPTGASADHMAVRTSTAGVACVVAGTLTDSLCVNSAMSGIAVKDQGLDTTYSTTMRGVTAEAPSTTGIGVEIAAGANGPGDGSTLHVHLTNVITHGGLTDLEADASGDASATATVTVADSDFATSTALGSPGTATIIGGASNDQTPPVFANAAKGDYHEAAGSATIDTGATDPKADTDLDGLPRTLGAAPDIGAYERPQAPIIGTVTKHKVKKTSAHLTAAVNPEGLATSVHAVATHGRSHRVTATVSAGSGGTSGAVHLALVGLAAHTKYAMTVIAKNADGSTHSTTITVTTH